MDREVRLRRDRVLVRPRLARRRDPLGRAPAEPHAEQVALRRVLGRRREVEPSVRFVDPVDADDVVAALGDELHVGAVARDRVDVPPAVALAHPEESLAALDPLDVPGREARGAPAEVAERDVATRVVLLRQDRADLAGPGVAQHHEVRVLEPVELLEDDLVGARGPVHAGQVVLARVAGNVEPLRRSARRAHDADARGGVPLAGLRVGERRDLRIEPGGLVDEAELLDARGVELPVGDPLAVGAPLPAVAAEELLLVDPVERPVDEEPRPVVGEPLGAAVREALDVEVVLTDVGDARPVGRELREHQRRRLGVAAELLERPARDVEQPVVAARVRSPDLLRVREDEQRARVRAQPELVDLERRARARRDELRRGHDDAPGPARRVVPHEVGRARARRGGLQLDVPGAVLLPLHGAERLRVVGEDRVEREEPGSGLLRTLSGRHGGRHEQRHDDECHHTSAFQCVSPVGSG